MQASLPAIVQLLTQPLVYIAPNELFLQRKVRTKFDMLQPDVQGVVRDKQSLQKKYNDNRAKLRTFTPGQTVMARDYLSAKKWIPGVIETSSGPTMYKVKIYNGKIIVRHIDQLLPANSQNDPLHSLRSSTMKIPTPLQDEIPAPRYNLTTSRETPCRSTYEITS